MVHLFHQDIRIARRGRGIAGWVLSGALALVAAMAGGEAWAMDSEEVAKGFAFGQLWIFGIVLTVICYLNYRNPRKFQATTTRVKYFIGCGIYCSTAILFYMFIASFPKLIPSLLLPYISAYFSPVWGLFKIDNFSNVILDEVVKQLPAFFALTVVLILVRINPIRRLHQWWLNNIRSLVNIPVEQSLLAIQLRTGNYRLFDGELTDMITAGDAPQVSPKEDHDDWLRVSIEDTLRRRQIDIGDWAFTKRSTLNSEWVKAISLFLRYQKAFADPRHRTYSRIFADQLEEREREFEKLRSIIPQLINDIRKFLDEHPEVKPGSLEEEHLTRDRFRHQLTTHREEHLEPFIRSLYEDFAGIVHCCTTTPMHRKQILEKFGFDYAPGLRDISVPLLTVAALLMFLTILIFINVAPEHLQKPELVVRMFSFELTAVFIALLVGDKHVGNCPIPQPVGWWAHLEEYMPPIAKAGIGGFLVGFVLNYGIETLLPEDMTSRVAEKHTWPLSLVPATTAATLVFLIIQRSTYIPQKWWLDAAILTVALLLSYLIVIFSLVPMATGTSLDKPPYQLIVTMCVAIGITIGGLIPSWWRRKQESLRTPQETPKP